MAATCLSLSMARSPDEWPDLERGPTQHKLAKGLNERAIYHAVAKPNDVIEQLLT